MWKQRRGASSGPGGYEHVVVIVGNDDPEHVVLVVEQWNERLNVRRA